MTKRIISSINIRFGLNVRCLGWCGFGNKMLLWLEGITSEVDSKLSAVRTFDGEE